MKCYICEDLLPLYVEGLCLEDTKKELEEHLKECPKCSEKLKLLQADLENEIVKPETGKTAVDVKEENVGAQDQKAVDSMKKVKKKLSVRKIWAIILGIVLICVISVVGVLYWGECTGAFWNFTTISNVITVRKISKDLCKGNLDTLLDYTYYDVQSIYVDQVEEKQLVAMQRQKEKLEQAFDYYFHGEKFKFKIVDVEFMYSNNPKTGVSEYWTGDYMNPAAMIQVKYYTKDASVNICYYQMADRKFLYEDDIEGISVGVPTFDSIGGDDTIPYIISRALNSSVKRKKSGAGALAILIHATKEYEKSGEWSGIVRGKVDALFEKGYMVSEMNYQICEYDELHHCLVSKCYFTITNDAGERLVMTQKFDSAENHFYIMDDAGAELVCKSEGFPADMVEVILHIFAPEE